MLLRSARGRNDSRGELIILPFEGGEPLKRFGVAQLGFSGSRIQWARDGKSLVYAAVGNGETAIVRQALEGGPPEKVMDFSEDELFDFGYSFDRQLFAVTRGEWKYDIVLISDLVHR